MKPQACEKENIERHIERLRDDAAKKAKAVRTAIQKAFANASAKELEALGQVAVLEAPLDRNSESRRNAIVDVATVGHPESVWAASILPSRLSVEEAFIQLGVKSALAQRVQAATIMGVDLGLPILCSGIGAAHVSTTLAAALCSVTCRVADIPVGIIRPIALASAFETGVADVLLLRNANLSDLSIYAPELLSLVVQRTLGKRNDQKSPALLFVGASGPVALPFPDEITRLAVKLDLAAIEATLEADAITPHDPISPLWRRIRLKAEALEESQPNTQAVFADLQKLVAVVTVGTDK